MGAKNTLKNTWHGMPVAQAMLCLGASLMLCLAGCEYRITQAEFMDMLRATEESPTTQPAAGVRPGQTVIDKRLGLYRLGADDVVGVGVTGPSEKAAVPAVQVRVTSRGTVELPLVGEVAVDGLTLEEAEAAIRRAYVPKYLPQAVVHVEVVSPHTIHVLVVDGLGAPKMVELRRNERNLLFAMARAGGGPQACSGVVTLRQVRQPGKEVTLNLSDPAGLEAALALEPLERGDIVILHGVQSNTIFVGGLVNAPRPQTYAPGTHVTILQALAAAGGLRTDVIPREATLIRRLDGRDVHVRLDLDRLATGKDENIALAAGDILWVPETLETRFHDFINRTLYLRVGASATYSAWYSDIGSQRYGDSKAAESGAVFITP